MKKLLLFSWLLVTVFSGNAYAVLAETSACAESHTCEIGGAPMPSNCSVLDFQKCYDGEWVSSCKTCASGYNRVQKSKAIPGCNTAVVYYTCQPELTFGETCSVSSGDSCDGAVITLVQTNCMLSRTECFGGHQAITCLACEAGYELTEKTTWVDGCTNKYSYNVCEPKECEIETGFTCDGELVNDTDNCKALSTAAVCMEGKKAIKCTACKDGYKLEERTLSVRGCTNTYTYKTCVPIAECEVGTYTNYPVANTLENCREYIWKSLGENTFLDCYRCESGNVTVTETGSVPECTNTITYRTCKPTVTCKPGWYANSTSTACLACPDNTSTESGVVGEGSMSLPGCGVSSVQDQGIEGCYYASSGFRETCSYSDSTGSYEYTANCYWESYLSELAPSL